MNSIDTLDWAWDTNKGFHLYEYRGRTLRVFLLGFYFEIGFGRRY